MATILTTTGISLYLNTAKNSNIKGREPTEDEMRQYLRLDPQHASSEANSLLQIAKSGDYLVFFHTKDPRAIVSTRLLGDYFENKGYKSPGMVELDFLNDAQQIERVGLRSLVDALITEIRKAQRKSPGKPPDIIINATAGYKAQVVYSTMVGMLYQIPVKYMYEDFKSVMTFNPIPLEWDTSIFLTYKSFFEWFDAELRKKQEVEQRLKGVFEREQVEALLEPPDADDYVCFSLMGQALWEQFRREEEDARNVDWPSSAGIEKIESKITLSDHNRDKKKSSNVEKFCLKIAALDYVKTVICSNFENTTKARIKQAYPNGVITLLWAGNNFAQNVIVQTTAQGKLQTLKVAEQIREILEK